MPLKFSLPVLFNEKYTEAQVHVALVRWPVDVFPAVKRLALCSIRLHGLTDAKITLYKSKNKLSKQI